MVSRRMLAGCLLSCGLLGLGCRPKGESEPPRKDGVVLEVPLVIRADSTTNDGRPLHVVVRGLTRKGFIEDDYSTIARLVIEADDSVVARMIVFPDQVQLVELKFTKLPEVIGVYGLFTRTSGESWKTMFEAPEQLGSIDLRAGLNGFVTDQRRR